jgi:hypothetical protein
MQVIRYSERPELWDDTGVLTGEVWPEYNMHGDVLNEYWGSLFDEFPSFQFVLYDDHSEQVLAEGHTAPCQWDGTPQGLGDGIDEMIVAAFEAQAARSSTNALCALAAEIRPQFQGRGLALRILEAMTVVAGDASVGSLIAPVRPSFKDRYPITPIERYTNWTNLKGEPFDPWIRIHVRHGGSIIKPVPRSLRITGTVNEWEHWTQMRFPEDGCYTFPQGLAPLTIDHGQDRGIYWEPNVWIVHSMPR